MHGIYTWKPPKAQEEKFCDGEGSCLKDGLSARVDMRGESDYGYLNSDGFDSHRSTQKHGTTEDGRDETSDY
jgi:hypothetical protein